MADINQDPNASGDRPDIVITNADLDAVDQNAQRIGDFFTNPQPKPAEPTALVEAKCSRTGRDYYIVFEQTQTEPKVWVVRESRAGTPTLSQTQAPGAQPRVNMPSGNIDWSGFATDTGKCPHCSAYSIFLCGCGKVSCHPDGLQGSPSICHWCGARGILSGAIQSLAGRSGKDKGKG